MQSITNVYTDGISIQNKKHISQSIKVTIEKRVPLWRRFIRLPILSSVKFIWNLITMFQFVLPLNITSRIWGWINGLQLPVWTRIPIYKLYSFLYHCNLEEMLDPDLKRYRNLSEFFRRSLKAECRPIDYLSSLISPVDGRVLSLGPVNAGQLHNVKGITYTLKGFLGPANWPESSVAGHFTSLVEKDRRGGRDGERQRSESCGNDNDRFIDEIKHCKDGTSTKLYHCIIYLAPGDYHKFHSPTDWTVTFRRHFPGKLFSVNPLFTSWIKNLFCLNERSVYLGRWSHGFFSLTAVGANNVGSITVDCDPLLRTNKPTSRLVRGAIRGWHIIARRRGSGGGGDGASAGGPRLQQRYYDYRLPAGATGTATTTTGPLHSPRIGACDLKPPPLQGVTVRRGQHFGEFNFGSTVVLIFEAPDNFRFSVAAGDKVTFGQSLGN